MKIGIIGAGRMGGNLGKLWCRAGHDVLFSSRHPDALEGLIHQAGPKARAGTVKEAVEFGELILFAPNFTQLEECVLEAGSLNNKLVMDIMNPVAWDAERGELKTLLPPGATAVEMLQHQAPGARLVKAFSNLNWSYLEQAFHHPDPDAEPIAVFYCGDDPHAKTVALTLIVDAGFAPLDIGGLEHAHLMEIPGPLSGKALPLSAAERLVAAVATEKELPPGAQIRS